MIIGRISFWKFEPEREAGTTVKAIPAPVRMGSDHPIRPSLSIFRYVHQTLVKLDASFMLVRYWPLCSTGHLWIQTSYQVGGAMTKHQIQTLQNRSTSPRRAMKKNIRLIESIYATNRTQLFRFHVIHDPSTFDRSVWDHPQNSA